MAKVTSAIILSSAKPLRTALLVAFAVGYAAFAGSSHSEQVQTAARPPRLHPDYAGLTVPPNIAPLNFSIQETGAAFRVELRATKGAPIEIQSRNPRISIPMGPWRKLLEQNKGGDLLVQVQARSVAGPGWTRYETITNHIAEEEIDPVLMYRKIHAVQSGWSTMALYQRDLRSFEETPFLENRRFSDDCCHCHTPHGGNPDKMTVLIRSPHYENRLLMISSNRVEAVRGSVGWNAWHPGGRIIASSFSVPRLIFHSARSEMRDVVELQGWIGYFKPGEYKVQQIPGLADSSRLRTFPAWSPDGAFLYFCSAPNPWTNMNALTAVSHKTAQYDLMRVSYDAANDRWGQPEVVVSAATLGFSIAQPRISPDGRWLIFCALEYGCWPVYDVTSDLWAVDLRAGRVNGQFVCRKLELNSPAVESLLSWSSNSRWVVFSSKRMSPLYNRPFLAYIGPDGTCSKPFVLPQKDPNYYDSLLKTYTIPVLATGPLKVSQREIIQAIKGPTDRVLEIPKATQGDSSR